MATVKTIAIRADLSACVDYAVNAEKTSEFGHLANSLGYISEGEKTAEARFVTALNCTLENAFNDMRETKLATTSSTRKFKATT